MNNLVIFTPLEEGASFYALVRSCHELLPAVVFDFLYLLRPMMKLLLGPKPSMGLLFIDRLGSVK